MANYTPDYLTTLSVSALVDLAEENEIEFPGKPTKAKLIGALVNVEAPEDDEELDDDEVEEELDDEVDDDEADDEVEAEETLSVFDKDLEALLDEDEEDDEELNEDEIDDEPAPPVKVKAARAAKTPRAPKADAAPRPDGVETLAAKQVAAVLGTEAKTLRQFFRSPVSTFESVGSGGRYEFLATDLDQIKDEFEAWKLGHASRGASKKSKSTPEVAEELPEVADIEELEFDDSEIEDDDLELDD